MASQTGGNWPEDTTDHMARLRMKLLQQKLENAKHGQSQGGGDGNAEPPRAGLDTTAIRYHQSVLKRQELLERIKAHHQRPDGRGIESPREMDNKLDANQPQPSQQPPPPPAQPQNTQPVQNPPMYSVQPLPLLQTAHTSQPIISAPLLVPLTNQQTNNKSEYFDMMMMQNAQMHQLFMQQMLMKGLQTEKEPQTIVVEQPHTTPPQQQPQIITIPSHTKRQAKTKHYHHYSQLPPIQPAQQPQMVERPYQINHIRHMDRRETPEPPQREETEPRRYPKVKLRPKPASPPSKIVPKITGKHPFPGSRLLRKLRHIFYAAWFVSFLRIAARKKKQGSTDDKFIFGIQLKEAIASLHRTYLNPDGTIFPLLRDIVSEGAEDLTKAFTANAKATQELIYVIENFVYNMTDIMPQTGVLGTQKKAVVFEMVQNGKEFPDGYFWEVETEMMKFDADGRTIEKDDKQARLLLLGLFISRSLVTTLLMRPLDYGLSSTLLDETAESNLRLVGSLMLYITRKASVPQGSAMMGVPHEVSQLLYTDEELRPLIERFGKTVDYAEELLRDWTKEYIRRLREVETDRGRR